MLNIRKIEELRKSKLFSQETFAKEIGMTKNGYQLALKKKDFKVSVLEKIAKVLDVPIGYFFDDKSETEKYEIEIKKLGNNKCIILIILKNEL